MSLVEELRKAYLRSDPSEGEVSRDGEKTWEQATQDDLDLLSKRRSPKVHTEYGYRWRLKRVELEP